MERITVTKGNSKKSEILVNGEKHTVGNEECNEGWCGVAGHPCRCSNCGGLIHAEFGDEDYDGSYWLYLKCDGCGDDYEE